MSSLGDALGYFVFRNPISHTILSTLGIQGQIGNNTKASQPVVFDLQKTLWNNASQSCFVRLAGLSGATAIIMSVYGKISLARSEDSLVQTEGKIYFDSAQRFHLLHSVALIAVPLAHRPILTGSLMVSGTVIFCGATYYRALTGNKNMSRIASYGGFCLVAAWISLMF